MSWEIYVLINLLGRLVGSVIAYYLASKFTDWVEGINPFVGIFTIYGVSVLTWIPFIIISILENQ